MDINENLTEMMGCFQHHRLIDKCLGFLCHIHPNQVNCTMGYWPLEDDISEKNLGRAKGHGELGLWSSAEELEGKRHWERKV